MNSAFGNRFGDATFTTPSISSRSIRQRIAETKLVGDPDEGIFSATTAFSRLRVQRVFEEAITGATDAPKQPLVESLGRLLYLVHLAVLLWWLLDKKSSQSDAARRISNAHETR